MSDESLGLFWEKAFVPYTAGGKLPLISAIQIGLRRIDEVQKVD